MDIRGKLNIETVTWLKKLARQLNLKGYSSKNKQDLIDFIVESRPLDAFKEIKCIYDDCGRKLYDSWYCIFHLDAEKKSEEFRKEFLVEYERQQKDKMGFNFMGFVFPFKFYFQYFNLQGANLQSAQLQYTEFHYPELQETNFNYANLLSANLQYANLQNAKLKYADLTGVNLAGANLQHADLQYAKLQEAKLQNADLQHANLQKVNLEGAYLQNADLQYANLQDANLKNADLKHAKLQEVNLQDANLQNAELQKANLQYSNLYQAYLADADLYYSDLQNADLHQADLHNANLQYANLQYANLQEVSLGEADLMKANLQHAKLSGAEMFGANFRGANLKNAMLLAVMINGFEFEGVADLTGITIFEHDARKIPKDIQKMYLHTFDMVNLNSPSTIIRSIEFPLEYHQAGVQILNYFGTILRQEYPDTKVKVNISQEGLVVTMTIETDQGDIKKIEEKLDEFGLVAVGKKRADEIITDPHNAIMLKTMLRNAQSQVVQAQEILELQKEQYGARISALEKDKVNFENRLDAAEKRNESLMEMINNGVRHSDRVLEHASGLAKTVDKMATSALESKQAFIDHLQRMIADSANIKAELSLIMQKVAIDNPTNQDKHEAAAAVEKIHEKAPGKLTELREVVTTVGLGAAGSIWGSVLLTAIDKFIK